MAFITYLGIMLRSGWSSWPLGFVQTRKNEQGDPFCQSPMGTQAAEVAQWCVRGADSTTPFTILSSP